MKTKFLIAALLIFGLATLVWFDWQLLFPKDVRFRAIAAGAFLPIGFMVSWLFLYWRRKVLRIMFHVFLLLCSVLVLGSARIVKYTLEHFTELYVPIDTDKRILAYEPAYATQVFAASEDPKNPDAPGQLICVFTDEYRIHVSLKDLSPYIKQAFVAGEDQTFDNHDGIDPFGIVRAILINYETGQNSQGASTITQQLVKQRLLSLGYTTKERNWQNKITETLLALKIEKIASKDEILQAYLNTIYFGQLAYGVGAAARVYFGKEAKNLTIAESAMLAGVISAPSQYSPFAHFDLAKDRQRYVLGRMLAMKFISNKEYQNALAEEILLAKYPLVSVGLEPYYCTEVAKQLYDWYGDKMKTEGYTVYTPLILSWQQKARFFVQTGLRDLDRRLGFIGPEGHEDAYRGVCDDSFVTRHDGAFVESVLMSIDQKSAKVCADGAEYSLYGEDVKRIQYWLSRAKKNEKREVKAGDIISVRIVAGDPKAKQGTITASTHVILAQRRTGKGVNSLEATLVAIEPNTGYVRAMVGGYGFDLDNQTNYATQGVPQAGSSAKPYVYYLGLDDWIDKKGQNHVGHKVTDTMSDHPLCLPSASGPWCPKNYGGKYKGTVNLRQALAWSLNSISVQLLTEHDPPEGEVRGVFKLIDLFNRISIDTTHVEPVNPAAVGAYSIAPYDQVVGYATIGSLGKQLPKQIGASRGGVIIRKVLDRHGNSLDVVDAPNMFVMRPEIVYELLYLMLGSVELDGGTGRRMQKLGRPIAAKTGTSNNANDLWFTAISPQLAVGTWVGHAISPMPVAIPPCVTCGLKSGTGGEIALPFVYAFMDDVMTGMPVLDFPVPSQIRQVLIGKELVPFAPGKMPAALQSPVAENITATSAPIQKTVVKKKVTPKKKVVSKKKAVAKKKVITKKPPVKAPVKKKTVPKKK